MTSAAPVPHAALHAAGAEASVSRALDRLRADGERLTAPRRAVLHVLAAHHEHLAADAVADELAAAGVHRTTVYRTLDLLVRAGVVTTRPLPAGATGYHLDVAPDGHGHLHAHCRSCGEVVAIPADALDAAVDAVVRATGFRLAPRVTDLAGVCAGCAPGD
ncbi:Fur family transcriptional regulator [Cellulomonas sp. C5510]|uniref:Fur family transcriptional regulator n=1 Tax=Cellulomonas sp. C5510 TaxID=2871170 RepID=UPI001C98A8E4|nr:transcriptional repressor [Cellulomonas sp. C5510]QZN87019.1 transcriptional repressor [Cellulomonas sp. C5510]